MSTLVPDYLNIDFTTIINRIKAQLADSDVFKDYDYRKDKEFKKYYERRWLKEKVRKKIEKQDKGERRRKR